MTLLTDLGRLLLAPCTRMRIRNANCYETVGRGHQMVLGLLLVPAKLYFGVLVMLGIARLKRLT